MPLLLANNLSTTLAADIAAGATSCSLASATGWPVPSGSGYFWATISDAGDTTFEVVKVTANAAGTLTIVRGQDNTTAQAWASGSKISMRINAQLLKELGGGILGQLGDDEIAVTGATTATIGRMHVCSGTSADYTVTLPAVSGNAGKCIGFRMASGLTKLVTLDAGSGVAIDGQQTRILWANESAVLLSDGSNWTKVAGKSIPMRGALYPNAAQLFANSTWTLLNYKTQDYLAAPSAFIDAANGKFIALRPCRMLSVSRIAYNQTNASACRAYLVTARNGVDASDVFLQTLANTMHSLQAVGTFTMAVGDYIQIAGYYTAGSYSTSVYDYTQGKTYNYFEVMEEIEW